MGCALAVAGQQAGELHADFQQPFLESLGFRRSGSDDRVPGGPVGQYHQGVVGAAVAVNGQHIQRVVGNLGQHLAQQALVNRGVGGYEAQHSRHVGMDHPRPLGHTADVDLRAAYINGHAHFLGVGVGGHHGAGQRVAAVLGQLNLLHARSDESHGQLDADDSRAEYQHFLGFDAQGA